MCNLQNHISFWFYENGNRIMIKILEIIGLVLVAIMFLGFVGAFQSFGIEPGLSPLFWGCAGVALMIIIYRKQKRKQQEENQK